MECNVTQRVRIYLKSHRYSIRKIAEILQMNEGTLSAKLNGARGLDIDTIGALLEALPDLSAEWLLRGTGNMETAEPSSDPELQAVCIDQAKEIYQLKLRIAELEREKKGLA